jgi:hypothetical protein
MKTAATWSKSDLLGIICSMNISHVLTHTISVIIGRLESMFLNQPTRREAHKIANGNSINQTITSIIYPGSSV